jgi:hypothetical protein
MTIRTERPFLHDAGSGSALQTERDRLPPGAALLLILAMSLAVWCALVAMLIAFNAV